jgi:dienelactone hydrolase
MPTTLVPTVHERIARCNTSIFLDRLAPGAAVVLSIDGTELSGVAPGGQMNFPVPSLGGGERIRAKQDAGSGFTPWSPEVEVEDAFMPPVVSPHLPEEVGTCSQCVHVSGMVPGCEVELFLLSTGDIVGQGTTDRGGAACVGVDLSRLRGEGFDFLGARMLVCGQPGPDSATPITTNASLPQPVIGGPLFGCQRMIPTSNLQPGARVRYEIDADDLGSFCSCWEAVNVWIGTDLVAGRNVRAIPYFERDGCKGEGLPSAWEPVLPPDDRIKPVVRPFLIEGDQTIRIDNQFANATLLVRIRPDASSPYEEFGPVAASQEPELDLNAPLVAGNVVTVVQTLCSVSVESDPVTVLPPPPVVLPPVVIPPLYECGTGVQVSNLHQGAFVRVFADDIPIGAAWAGNASSIAVPANLLAGWKITARQRVGGIWSQVSDPAIVVDVARLEPPRIMRPVAEGDRAVWVSHVTPGAHVAIWHGGTKLGGIDATEPIVRVPVSPVPGAVRARARLCGKEVSGERVETIETPCGPGAFANAAEQSKTFPDFDVPEVVDGGKFTVPITGQLYFPSDDGKSWARGARNLPLVVIAHGFWRPMADSYLGYDYLARHLARWGMVVYSLNLDEVNNLTSFPTPQQYARGEILLHVIDELSADPDVGRRIDVSRAGLIGHSMGGEGVTAAQFLNDNDGRGYGIRGVVSIAPTNHRPEIALRNTKYLQLLGSMDLLSGSLAFEVKFNGFRLHDRAWYPKSHAWIYGARHNPFNRKWLADGDTFESGWADLALPPAEHEAIARCLINAFFQDALFDRSDYAGYLESTILPQSLRHLQIHMQHRRAPRRVVDNHGDADEQEALAAEPIDKTTNRLGLGVNAAGAGLVSWEDVELEASAASVPHQGLAVELAWNPPVAADVVYGSPTGALAANEQDAISLRLGQFYEDAAVNPAGYPADLFVTLDDGGNQATVRAGAVAPIPYPDDRPAAAKLCPMRTIRIPLDAFTIANPAFDRSNITSVRLDLTARPTGHIFADDLELSS